MEKRQEEVGSIWRERVLLNCRDRNLTELSSAGQEEGLVKKRAQKSPEE